MVLAALTRTWSLSLCVITSNSVAIARAVEARRGRCCGSVFLTVARGVARLRFADSLPVVPTLRRDMNKPKTKKQRPKERCLR